MKFDFKNHIIISGIATIIFVLLAMFIYQGEVMTKDERGGAVALWVFMMILCNVPKLIFDNNQ